MKQVTTQLYRTKLLLVAVVLVTIGITLLIGNRLAGDGFWHWVPLSELGGILVGAGLLSIWLDHVLRAEQEALDDQRLRRILTNQAPVMRDAVLEAFAANHKDLRRIATPELLDQMITNSLALRLHDSQFASEIYADIHDQAVQANERWYDATVAIDLAPIAENRIAAPRTAARIRTSGGLFSVTVRWEYTTVPKHAQRRFACVSDRDEYAELATERGNTSAWYLKPGNGVDASHPESFELVRFAVEGEERPIRRSARKTGQTYSVNVGAEHVTAGTPVTITYTYRTVTSRTGHLLFFDIEQPTRDLSVSFGYRGCGLAAVSVLDLIPSVRAPRIERPRTEPSEGDMIRVDLDGWVFPRSGVAFVWTLDSESAPAHPRQGRIVPRPTGR